MDGIQGVCYLSSPGLEVTMEKVKLDAWKEIVAKEKAWAEKGEPTTGWWRVVDILITDYEAALSRAEEAERKLNLVVHKIASHDKIVFCSVCGQVIENPLKPGDIGYGNDEVCSQECYDESRLM